MDSHRALKQGYGSGYPSAGRAIPPTAMPSLSTGQGFYTVESLEGVTVVPPPQPAPPPPRLLPSEPYPQEFSHPRMTRRLHPAELGDFGDSNLFHRRYPPQANLGRKMMIPSRESPLPRRREDPRMVHRRPPLPFMDEPRMPGFFHGSRKPAPPPPGVWGPYRNSRSIRSDRDHDRSRSFQRSFTRTQSQKGTKPLSQAKSITNSAADEKSSVRKQKLDHGEGHKKPMESHKQVGKTAEIKEDAIDKAIAEKGAKSEVKAAKIAPKVEDISTQKGFVRTPQPVTPVAGKKRSVEGVTQTNKKSRKSTGPSVRQSDTPVKSKDERETVEATCTKDLPDVCIKGVDDAVSLLKSEGNKFEQKEDNPKVVEADGNEGREDVGQSAEIQWT